MLTIKVAYDKITYSLKIVTSKKTMWFQLKELFRAFHSFVALITFLSDTILTLLQFYHHLLSVKR